MVAVVHYPFRVFNYVIDEIRILIVSSVRSIYFFGGHFNRRSVRGTALFLSICSCQCSVVALTILILLWSGLSGSNFSTVLITVLMAQFRVSFIACPMRSIDTNSFSPFFRLPAPLSVRLTNRTAQFPLQGFYGPRHDYRSTKAFTTYRGHSGRGARTLLYVH